MKRGSSFGVGGWDSCVEMVWVKIATDFPGCVLIKVQPKNTRISDSHDKTQAPPSL